MELSNMTKLEFEKYKKMNREAHASQRAEKALIELIGIAIFAFCFSYGIRLILLVNSVIKPLLVYASALLQSVNLSFNTNASIATSISTLVKNSQLQVAYFLQYDFSLYEVVALIAGIIFILLGISIFIFFDLLPVRYSIKAYHGLEHALKEQEKIYKRLAEKGYTKKEISWYFEVKSKIEELENKIN
ncbi:MAG: hypothetical protein QXN16_00740 [Candidatus Micrarchaeaceae archaeon]